MAPHCLPGFPIGGLEGSPAVQVAEIEARVAKEGLPARRNAVLQHWWGDEVVSREPFYFDSRGDPDNVTYEGLYRFHVPAFQRVDVSRSGGPGGGARPYRCDSSAGSATRTYICRNLTNFLCIFREAHRSDRPDAMESRDQNSDLFKIF